MGASGYLFDVNMYVMHKILRLLQLRHTHTHTTAHVPAHALTAAIEDQTIFILSLLIIITRRSKRVSSNKVKDSSGWVDSFDLIETHR